MNLLEAILYLTLNVYHEARSEDQLAQVAVAHVTMNRAEQRHLSVKDVVLQPYQFSWVGQKDRYFPTNIDAFIQCLESVIIAARGHDFTGGATHYHHETIIPEWTNRLQYVAGFGTHKFYKGRGQ